MKTAIAATLTALAALLGACTYPTTIVERYLVLRVAPAGGEGGGGGAGGGAGGVGGAVADAGAECVATDPATGETFALTWGEPCGDGGVCLEGVCAHPEPKCNLDNYSACPDVALHAAGWPMVTCDVGGTPPSACVRLKTEPEREWWCCPPSVMPAPDAGANDAGEATDSGP